MAKKLQCCCHSQRMQENDLSAPMIVRKMQYEGTTSSMSDAFHPVRNIH